MRSQKSSAFSCIRVPNKRFRARHLTQLRSADLRTGLEITKDEPEFRIEVLRRLASHVQDYTVEDIVTKFEV